MRRASSKSIGDDLAGYSMLPSQPLHLLNKSNVTHSIDLHDLPTCVLGWRVYTRKGYNIQSESNTGEE
jgi:hypothetical protein